MLLADTDIWGEKDDQLLLLMGEKEKYEQDMKLMREEMNQQFTKIMSMIQQNPKLLQVKPEVLSKKTPWLLD